MTLQSTARNTFHKLSTPMSGLATLALVAGTTVAGTSIAAAQDGADRDDTDYEYEYGEGMHEEEWYDPSDWFNADSQVSYETDDWDYDGYYGTYSDFDYDAYYDGYYDGYYDDSFGYDNWDAAWNADYSTHYTAGYYDGYYDAQTGYDFDSYYYVYETDTTRSGTASDRQRTSDPNRERGDRMTGAKDRSASSDKMDRGKDYLAVKQRVRGVVDSTSMRQQTGDTNKRHMIGQISFTNGTDLRVDFGPHANRNNLMVESGDVITVVGNRISRNDQNVLKANRLVIDGKVHRLSGQKDKSDSMRGKDAKQKDRDRSRSGRDGKSSGN